MSRALIPLLLIGAMAVAALPLKGASAAQGAPLPDWSCIWSPDIGDQERQERSNPAPWAAAVADQIKEMKADEAAGHPHGLFTDCFPEGMPSWMLISHNAMEILFSPGRVTLLGESDGNRLRRIYTDGRGHSAQADPSFHGDSIGHWEGATLVVDTVAIRPEVYVATSESLGIPNNGDMHIIEHIHLEGADRLKDDMEIIAPKVLSKPWKTTRIFIRQRPQKFDIVEGVCLEGNFLERKDKYGNAIWQAVPQDGGISGIPASK